ncbi:glycosyltransferase family 4 protein [Rhodopirellula sp. JC740]|uniref:Glycosyltransferase family 4 protein n=1 Tax=Rhodopirellula halodulae TaxID=2894198 RepID=A0ABS8NFQ2_9BACT|nr:glycosyltransferase family 4 protein [Rhodopirellula sp. JC740]
MSVLAWPATRTRNTNPYPFRVQDSTSAFGVSTSEFNLRNVLRVGWDVIHVHWPEVPLRIRYFPVRLIVCVGILVLLRCHKLIGRSKIVWTTHNLEPHERRVHWLTRWYFSRFLRMVDGTISLSEFGRDELFRRHPSLQEKASVVVRHGHYRGDYPTEVDRNAARKRLSLEDDDRVLLSLGMIRPYKNLPLLASLVHRIDHPKLKLVIAGPGKSPKDETILRDLAEQDHRIRLAIAFLPAQEVAEYFAACDLVVLPYSDILNSGSLLLALSMSRPALITDKGATPEIAGLVGHSWVQMYSGELTMEAIQRSLDAGRPEGRPDLSHFEWPLTGQLTSTFFRRLIGQPITADSEQAALESLPVEKLT